MAGPKGPRRCLHSAYVGLFSLLPRFSSGQLGPIQGRLRDRDSTFSTLLCSPPWRGLSVVGGGGMGGLGTPLPGAAAEDGSAARRVQGSCRAQAPSAGDITESTGE